MSVATSNKAEIKRQYDEVISLTYDTDPQGVTHSALNRAFGQLNLSGCLSAGMPVMNVLDIGLGTGLFLEKLREQSAREMRPFGLDVSAKMVAVAQSRIADLVAAIDDGANIDQHFTEESFDLIATHFVTGFVSIDVLAPRIFEKLRPGGYWTFCGGTKLSFPALQSLANNKNLRRLFGKHRDLETEELLVPADQSAVERCFAKYGFEVCQSETFSPTVKFGNYDEFMDFAYRGSWLTAFVEELGLQHAGWMLRTALNWFVFPVQDHHTIVIGLARKPLE